MYEDIVSIHAPSHLGTLADARSVRSAQHKGAMRSRLEDKDAVRKLDEQKLAVWRKAVTDRDQWRDRFTGKRVERTIELKPNRAEAHHHEPRANREVRYDVRNGITLSASTHARIKAGTLTIVARKDSWFYTTGGLPRVYLDMGGPVKFVETRP